MISVSGSSGRRGTAAFLELLTNARKENFTIVLTHDVPKSSIYQVHIRVIKLAALSGLPIVPVCFDFDNVWRVKKAWDNYIIPKPCSNVTVLWKKRIYIPSNISEDEIAEYAEERRHLLSEGRPDFSLL